MEVNQLRNDLCSISKYGIFFFIVGFILIGYQFISHTSHLSHVNYKSSISSRDIFSLNKSGFPNNTASSERTLVVYVYGKTHPLAEENLAFFIQTAVHDSDHADYYFVLQQINNVTFNEQTLPVLPSNAHYVQHENKCYDIGTIGWFFSRNIIDRTKYKYFIFLNSSIRGPFIVSYYENTVWYKIFTRRLNDHIKLVGCTINCEVFPHVQSYFWALDFEGIDLLLTKSNVLACHKDLMDTIYKGEIGASRKILDAGFGIDSLMKKYENMDFRLKKNQNCNNITNPTFLGVDGIYLDPFEIVFVKIKDWSNYEYNRERVGAYEKWIRSCKTNCSSRG